MKTVLRSFLSVLRRFKTAALLNILGLSVAYVAFMMIMMQINYDRTFDCNMQSASHIFRMDLMYEDGSQAVINRPFARAFTASSPHIKAGTIMSGWALERFFNVERDGQKINYKEGMQETAPEILNVFHFDMIEGNEQSLQEPNSVILPESLAKKLFGPEPAMGKLFVFNDSKEAPKQVKGIYRDFPQNSSLKNVIYFSMDPKKDYDEWGNSSYLFYVRLDSPENKEMVIDNFKKNFDTKNTSVVHYNWEEDDIRLTALPELHFLKNVDFDPIPKASRQTLKVLFAIAFIILAIAGINFTNFSTALTPLRIKSINTQKVLGSSDSTLRGSLLVEAVCISVFAYLVSLFLLYWATETPIASLLDAEISFKAQAGIICLTGLLSVGLGLLAGFYPASYITSFPPALILKGSFGLSPKGRQMRSVLVSIQFIASFALIIGALFMYLQNYFMQHSPLGYEKDELIAVTLNNTINKNREAFTNQMKSFSGIEDVTYSQFLLASGDQYMGWGREYNDKIISFQCIPVSSTFLKVMGIEVTEGRDFRPEDDLKETGTYIFNEKARSMYDIKLNEKIYDSEIVGFVPDIKFASFRQEVSPMAFYLWGKKQWWNDEDYVMYGEAYVKVKAGSDMRAAMEHVKTSLSQFDSEYPFSVRFYDEVIQRTYEKELKISTLISLFSLVAIFISIVGVFGLVVFESEYKRKEIAVRKILGSTTGQILYMFNKSYLWILIICFVLAAPLAWYGVSRWLENFAYRTPMYWWVLPIAFLLVGLITAITVTYQNWHVANENPVNNIKSE